MCWWLGCRLSCSLSFSKWALFWASCWVRLIHQIFCCLISVVSSGPNFRFLRDCRQFWINLRTHAPILCTLRSPCDSNNLTKSSRTGVELLEAYREPSKHFQKLDPIFSWSPVLAPNKIIFHKIRQSSLTWICYVGQFQYLLQTLINNS